MIPISQRSWGLFHLKALFKSNSTHPAGSNKLFQSNLTLTKHRAPNSPLRGGKEHTDGALRIPGETRRPRANTPNPRTTFAPTYWAHMAPACVLQSPKPDISFIPNANQEREAPDAGAKALREDGPTATLRDGDTPLNSERLKMEAQEPAALNGLAGAKQAGFTRAWHFPKNAVPDENDPARLSGAGREFEFKSFKVMTFNALAQSLVDYKYRENDQTTMSWAKRRHEILRVIEEADCDVLCLQEIDEMDYANFFKAKVEALGYEGAYKRKLQNRLDGILTLYRRDRYQLVLKNELSFSSLHEEFDKPQVALVLALRDMHTTRSLGGAQNGGAAEGAEDVLIVANTHLIFNKSRGDVKLYQLCNLMTGIKQTQRTVLEQLRERGRAALAPNVLVCGDFNLTPQSLLYNLIFEGFAPLRGTNPRYLSGQYLMFDQTYLTSSSGHNESGETLGTIRHYIGDVYRNTADPKEAKPPAAQDSESTEIPTLQPQLSTNSDAREELHRGPDVLAPEPQDAADPEWYLHVLSHVEKSGFTDRPEFVPEHAVREFLGLVQGAKREHADAADELGAKLSLRPAERDPAGRDADPGLVYCPFNLRSAYAADDGFNCEPAFTAFHGWQRGCVDYICYDPEHTALEGIYEMPRYAQIKQGGDLPHRNWPASDHFSLVSQLRRFK